MDTVDTQRLTDALFTIPQKFAREHPKSFLYAPYSRKSYRRVYLYTHLAYDLWVKIEADDSIKFFNERPPEVSLASDGKVKIFSPSIVAKTTGDDVQVHVISPDSSEDTARTGEVDRNDESVDARNAAAQDDWARQHGYSLVRWNVQSLRQNRMRLENLKQLLRFVGSPERVIPHEVKLAVKDFLSQRRTVTIHYLLESLRDLDEDWAMAAIADMILSNDCYSDIDIHRFHYATELSLYHEFNPT